LEGRPYRVLEHDDYGYSSWHGYERSPALEAIAGVGWVERHLGDFVLLAESPGLGDCCRATARELFGVPAFHVSIQFFPVADGLVQRLCHDPLDKLEHVRRTAGQLTYYREAACGSYPPPGWGGALVSTGSPVFEARQVWPR